MLQVNLFMRTSACDFSCPTRIIVRVFCWRLSFSYTFFSRIDACKKLITSAVLIFLFQCNFNFSCPLFLVRTVLCCLVSILARWRLVHLLNVREFLHFLTMLKSWYLWYNYEMSRYTGYKDWPNSVLGHVWNAAGRQVSCNKYVNLMPLLLHRRFVDSIKRIRWCSFITSAW